MKVQGVLHGKCSIILLAASCFTLLLGMCNVRVCLYVYVQPNKLEKVMWLSSWIEKYHSASYIMTKKGNDHETCGCHKF